MSADDQAFLDTLSSVPNDIRRYSNDVADYVDKHLEKVSNILREALSSSQWIPESARPRPPPPQRTYIEKVSSPASAYAQLHSWVTKNKILTTVIVIAIGGITYHVITRKTRRKKRRAKRAGNGARLEVVVIAGQASEPITRSISLDLERRGFIVYVVCNTIEEEMVVQNESRPDIKPLMIDITDPSSAQFSIEKFKEYLQTPHAAFQGAKFHHLTFRSLIIIPSTAYPSSSIARLNPTTLSDLLNTRLLAPILTAQTFLPLLESLPSPHQHLQPHSPPAKPSVLVLTPNIISSLSPAYHLPESSIVAALSSFSSVLSAELAPLNIPVTHLQLGTFDLRAFSPHNRQLQTLHASHAETQRWDDPVKSKAGSLVGNGTSLRVLNDAVFDSMERRRAGVIRIGMGSSLYGIVGRWAPSGLVGWMMGSRRLGGISGATESFGQGSRGTSPRRNGNMEDSEYVSVHESDKGAR
ncbi:Uncharacterized protein BP5553_08718 [Venustampulla echinocandica]|uniref:DUF1776-domain-containing protein n=1 Tax=Venustampulla echinocandica TaxID=2656787 RepID=A0A370TF24_9HELO|nr:Uncharacterized protein BP5553_08718 [Venustampulla echinocandica]RDL33279.1 Uncharacterized protein BP5553_08718 [Venustampulla echinocandica]